VHSNDTARLDFIQNIEYKYVELLSLDFIKTPEVTVKGHIAFRYNALKVCMYVYVCMYIYVCMYVCVCLYVCACVCDAKIFMFVCVFQHKYALLHARFQELTQLIKIKNPSLLVQLQRSSLVTVDNASVSKTSNAFK